MTTLITISPETIEKGAQAIDPKAFENLWNDQVGDTPAMRAAYASALRCLKAALPDIERAFSVRMAQALVEHADIFRILVTREPIENVENSFHELVAKGAFARPRRN